jgi:hypothetical protein
MVGGGVGEEQFLIFQQTSNTQSQITVNVTFTSPLMEAPSSLKLIHNPVITLSMRYCLSHQTGQIQGNDVKIFFKYYILNSEQYGFRVGLRTDNATYKLTTEILNAVNNNNY